MYKHGGIDMEKVDTTMNKNEKQPLRAKRTKRTKRSKSDTLLNILIVVLLIASGVMFSYKTLTSEAIVRGQSMENTLVNDEKLVYEKWTQYIGDYNKKDILILKEDSIKNINGDEEGLIVKRLIAKAGDTVEFNADGKPIINGEELNETYIKEQKSTKMVDFSHIIEQTNKKYNTNFDVSTNKIPEGYYFVMGDNRNNSSDSRVFGLFKKADIIGHVIYSWTYHRFY